jgi:hypothetical protein
LCSIYCKVLVVDRKHAYKSCGERIPERIWNDWIMDRQSWLSKCCLEKKFDFHLFWNKQKS